MTSVRQHEDVEFAELVPKPIRAFLSVATPAAWLQWAGENVDTLLLDHANCEKKAASTAVATLFRYAAHERLAHCMSRLAREELRHFEQVSALLKSRGIVYRRIRASRYAGRLLEQVAGAEPARLRDLLICGAFIEARSCERFAALIPQLDEELARFYRSLLKSEARHFENYLGFAREALPAGFEARVAQLREVEARAVCEPDDAFSFHSGPPATE